ncbi:hypothetical protein KNP414_03348 [Paenibacillus mucilaginosus KNP414]|uniref:Uncharacterized protein n=1 Tax=Paenibacillus mucilaginosus (strain KNP414) TaxID=1036673 RepID=F8F618_PAEMK|nr:hypothetical protein KNP414_03348 [Paenibacillus mucilaginosus KNP414]
MTNLSQEAAILYHLLCFIVVGILSLINYFVFFMKNKNKR